jgi:hypothetical protein
MNARTLIALLLAASAAGCADHNGAVRISQACFPPTPNDDGSCSYPSAACDAVWMANPWVNATYVPTQGTLEWPLQIDNLRPNNAAREGGVNTATAFVTGYKISFTSASATIPDVSFDTSQRTVEAAGSTVLSVPVIPPGVATLLAAIPAATVALVRAEVRAIGHFADATTFETAPFAMVVEVRNNLGSGVGCFDPALPTLVGVCPQPGQSAIGLCK